MVWDIEQSLSWLGILCSLGRDPEEDYNITEDRKDMVDVT